MFYNFRKNKKAFTLVELIVVIAIIAILGTVVGVSVTGFVNSAKKRSAESTASSIASVWDMFVANADSTQLGAFLYENFPNDYSRISTDMSLTLTAQTVAASPASYKNKKIRYVTKDKWFCDVIINETAGAKPNPGSKGSTNLANVVAKPA